jgi:ATP-dependent protease ClpP protease subunit
MQTENIYFQENPQRSIFVSGKITTELVSSLTPEILKLRHASSDPITVYIDSFGGSVYDALKLIGLLNSPNQEGKICRLITVATGTVGSMASTILIFGDYVIAYPSATLMFHGTWRTPDSSINRSKAEAFAEELEAKDQERALERATKCFHRFFHRLTLLGKAFEDFIGFDKDEHAPFFPLLEELAKKNCDPSTMTLLTKASIAEKKSLIWSLFLIISARKRTWANLRRNNSK